MQFPTAGLTREERLVAYWGNIWEELSDGILPILAFLVQNIIPRGSYDIKTRLRT